MNRRIAYLLCHWRGHREAPRPNSPFVLCDRCKRIVRWNP